MVIRRSAPSFIRVQSVSECMPRRFPSESPQTGILTVLVWSGTVRYPATMNTVDEIKAAIPSLTLEERAEVARCLHDWQDDEWDLQMRGDLAGGKLAGLLQQVDKDIADGNLSELP